MQVQGRMKTSTHLLVGHAFDHAIDREALNRIRQSQQGAWKSKLRSALNTLTQWLLRDPNEPRVKQAVDRFNSVYWTVYDPQVRQSLTFSSEAEVRQWLDQRYYQGIRS